MIEVGKEVVEDDTHLGQVAAASGVDLQHAYGGEFADGVPVPDDACAVALADDSCAVALAAASPDDYGVKPLVDIHLFYLVLNPPP